jgi:two-component system NtrC family sensor kinase
VFLNLLQNAVQALEGTGGGDIWISTEVRNGTIQIVFKDNASGIPEEILSRIFEPFFTTKEVGKGTGLGLSISQRIVRDHGGEITVKSTPGEGSEFIISLPLRQAKAA